MKIIDVGVADDHPIVLAGVATLLKDHPDIEVKFTADTINSLLAALNEYRVSVLICDYQFDDDPMGDGLHLLGKIRRSFPNTQVLFLSAHVESHVISGALKAGAAGFIGKNRADFANLPAAVRSAHQRTVFLPSAVASRLLSNIFGHNKRAIGMDVLSEKEATVARLICKGLSISQIADKLNRSPKTISNQKNAAMRKLGARNDVELSSVIRDICRGDKNSLPEQDE